MIAAESIASAARLSPLIPGALPERPLVSILVGNYNYAHYLGETIESVLSQSYGNWELVICDDGSTDASVAVIEHYMERDRRIRLVRKSNGGHTSALNAAFSVCRGDIVCLLDSDDLFLPNKIESVVKTCSLSPQSGLIVHRVIRVNAKRRRQGVWPLSNSLPEGWFGLDLLTKGGILGGLPPTSGLSLRRELAETLFPLPTNAPLHMCPDQVIMRLAPLVARLGRIPEALAEQRLHGANTYGQSQVTVHSVSRELELSQALWKGQLDFLSRMSPELARQLAPLKNNMHIALLEYLRAKLSNEPGVHAYHREYLSLSGQGRPKWLLFWRASIWLPTRLFQLAINVLLGQGMLKQLVARAKGLA